MGKAREASRRNARATTGHEGTTARAGIVASTSGGAGSRVDERPPCTACGPRSVTSHPLLSPTSMELAGAWSVGVGAKPTAPRSSQSGADDGRTGVGATREIAARAGDGTPAEAMGPGMLGAGSSVAAVEATVQSAGDTLAPTAPATCTEGVAARAGVVTSHRPTASPKARTVRSQRIITRHFATHRRQGASERRLVLRPDEKVGMRRARPRAVERGRLTAYQPVLELGRTASTVVVLCLREGPGGFVKPCVIKRLRTHAAAEPRACAALSAEGLLGAKVNHANVAPTCDMGAWEAAGLQVPFVVFEYVDGASLHAMSQAADQLGVEPAPELLVKVVAEALAGLEAVHAATDFDGRPLGALHLRVRPRAIRVGFDGRVRLTDVGAGRDGIGARGELAGAPGYMAPEYVATPEADARADVFLDGRRSLGAPRRTTEPGRAASHARDDGGASAAPCGARGARSLARGDRGAGGRAGSGAALPECGGVRGGARGLPGRRRKDAARDAPRGSRRRVLRGRAGAAPSRARRCDSGTAKRAAGERMGRRAPASAGGIFRRVARGAVRGRARSPRFRCRPFADGSRTRSGRQGMHSAAAAG